MTAYRYQGRPLPASRRLPALWTVACTSIDMNKQEDKGRGPASAGQSGDTQGLPDQAPGSSESVVKLVQEGQILEAELLLGLEEARDAGVAEVRTKQVPGDGVPAADRRKLQTD